MANPYSNVAVFSGILIAAGVASSFGQLPAGAAGGYILEVSVSTQENAAAVNDSVVTISLGTPAIPTTPIYSHFTTNGGSANATWIVNRNRFDGPSSVGIEILTGSRDVWAISDSPNTTVRINIVYGGP